MFKISSAGLKDSASATPDFTIFTSAMEIDSERENTVRMIGSSTERDLHGDTMAISALTDMAQVEPGLVIWLNHDYELPGSLFGSLLEKPELRLKDGVADLHIVSSVEMSNPNAVLTYGYIKKGTRLGCSIGCMILECEIDEANDDGMSWWPPLIITHVQPLEWSVVGIPANQRSWVENAIKGLFDRSLNHGRVDDALRLAPAMKSLWPKDFPERLKGIEDASLKRELEAVPARPAPKRRIEWDPKQKTFVMNQKGVVVPFDRKDIPAFLAKSSENTAKTWKDAAAPSGHGILMVPDPEPNTLTTPEVENAVLRALEKQLGIWDTVDKGASGKTTWPLADEDTAWDKGAAHKRIMEWAGGDDPDWAKVKSVHFWFDDEKADIWGGYKLPFCDRINDEIKAVPHAIYACTGGHGLSASDIPDDDVPAIKKKIEVYYHKLGKKAPWEDQDDKEDAVEPGKESNMDTTKTKAKDTNESTASSEALTASAANAETKEAVSAIQETQEVVPATPKEEAEVHTLKSGEGALIIRGDEGATLAKIPLAENPASPLDLQLFNALAARFGQPQLTLDAQGQIIAPKAFPELTPEVVQEVIAKTLNFVEVTKGGSEFSKENREKLQSLHDGMVDMCKSSFHPCKEMAANSEGGDDSNGGDDGGDDGNSDGGSDEQKGILSAELLTASSEIPALREDFKALIDTLKSQGHLVDPKAVKDLTTRIDAADRRLKDIQAQTKNAEEQLAVLKNAPLGQPTLLKRGIQNNGDIATHEDFKALSAGTMNANERRWSLDEALRETTVIQRTLPSKEIMNYRKWPAGVGGSVENGVRPALTKDQRGWMHPAEWLSYDDGNEAFVPCYDDPCGIEA